MGHGLLVIKLAKSRRSDGKPRQEIVAHLGSLRLDIAELPEDDLKGVWWRTHFWVAMDERLEFARESPDAGATGGRGIRARPAPAQAVA